MSLTEESEIENMFKKESIQKHDPKFLGDGTYCATKGRCKNTDACRDCVVYKSHVRIDLEKSYYSDI